MSRSCYSGDYHLEAVGFTGKYRNAQGEFQCEKCGGWFCAQHIDEHYDEDGYRCEPEQYDGELIDGLIKTVDRVSASTTAPSRGAK